VTLEVSKRAVPHVSNLTTRKGDAVRAGLEGPSKTITVEPVEQPLYVPDDIPVEEPVKV